jgi:putative ABC transport system ATP-binding protein
MHSSAAPEPAREYSHRLDIAGLVVARTEAGRPPRRILDGIDFSVAPGETVAVTGPSGAGKTTLLHAIAGLVRPLAGTVRWDGVYVAAYPEAARDRWRRDTVGLVFQDFELVTELGILANILLPVTFDHWHIPAKLASRAAMLAERIGLGGRSLRARSLSRGEQQRVAIARALIRAPRLILADEPTASLDAENGTAVADLLIGAAREAGASLVLVSHDPALLARATRVHRLSAGRLSLATGAP